MDRETYLSLVRDLLSGQPERVRRANRVLHGALVNDAYPPLPEQGQEADLVLAEVPQPC